MISLYTIFSILVIHWIFDFMLQTQYMANNKSKSYEALSEHVFVYSFGVILMGLFNAPLLLTPTIFLSWLGINVLAHFLTDYVTSRATSLLYKDENYHDFFVTIGADQMIHYMTLFSSYYILTK